MTLKSRLAFRFFIGMLVLGALLFIPAGSFKFWQGWVYIASYFALAILRFAYFYKHDPQLIERTVQVREKMREQKRIIALVYVTLMFPFTLPGLDHRFGWSHSPLWLTIFSQAVVFCGGAITFWAMKVNRFAAPTIQVGQGHELISSGPYCIVHHPMYLGVCAICLFTPVALGSYLTLPAFVLLIPLIVRHLLREERVLRQKLPGYAEYCHHTRFRLVPFLW